MYARFKDNIWATDLAEIGLLYDYLLSKWDLLCVIDAFTKYASFKPFNDQKAKPVLDSFTEIH